MHILIGGINKVKAYRINHYHPEPSAKPLQTKFGGQPDWLAAPQWPVSAEWTNRPMKFLGQIRLDQIYDEIDNITMAYLFITQPEDENDLFFDPDIIFPDGGENALVIQPAGRIPDFISLEERRTGPTVDHKNTWLPQISEIEETSTSRFKEIDCDKFSGLPAFFQNSMIDENDKLLLQLHTNWLPFYLNAGGSPTLFAMLKENGNEGYILIEDM